MLFSFVALPYIATALHTSVTLPPAGYYLFFISNFYLEGHVYFLRFLWTLSVEEQFYLVWGICLLFFQQYLLVCVSVFMSVSIVFTIYTMNHHIYLDFNTLTYLFDFAVGILTAVILQRGSRLVYFFKKISRRNAVLFLLALPALFFILFIATDLSPVPYARWLDLAGRYIFIIYTGLFIIEQMVNENPVLKLKSNRFLIYTGKISYGLYCFHGIVLTLGAIAFEKLHLPIPMIVRIFILLAINYLVSTLSYRFIEKPFLKLKDSLRRT